MSTSYQLGKLTAAGRYPVTIDGIEVGEVYRHARTWYAQYGDDARATSHDSRDAAAQRLVGCREMRTARALEIDRRMRLRTTPPEGWQFRAWAEVEPGTTVRMPVCCRPVDDVSGPMYPQTWSPVVTISRVEMLGNGGVVAHWFEGLAPHASLLLVRHAEIGALVPASVDPKETR